VQLAGTGYYFEENRQVAFWYSFGVCSVGLTVMERLRLPHPASDLSRIVKKVVS
jgi:hypothetical protein